MSTPITRRKVLTGLGIGAPTLVLGGCDPFGSSPTFQNLVLSSGEWLAYNTHRLIGSTALAREYDPADMSPRFRTNGNTMPRSAEYLRHARTRFADWRLSVGGRVAREATYSLADLKAMPSRSQITRHDCVEGWSAIGKWTGVPLARLLEPAGLDGNARYVVLRCADDFNGTSYYESIDLVDAFHPQTILAYSMNDSDLPVGHGAPIRLRVERQLGYKHAKFVMGIDVVASLAGSGRGRGGYWEDVGNYDWYAGI